MSDDYEESPYEDDEPRQATAVDILPPPKKQLSWPQIALYAFGILMAGKVCTHAIDRLSSTASAGVPQTMVTDNLPVSPHIEDRRGAAEEPPPRWHYGVTPRTWASAYPPRAYREPEEEDSDLTYERRRPPRHHAANIWPGHNGSEIEEDEERERDLEDARRVGREAAQREADRPSRGFWPFFEAIDPGSQARHERYMAYVREMQRQRGGY